MTCVPLQLLQKELRELEGGDAGEGGGEGGAPSGVDALAVRAARGQHVSEPVAPSRTAWSPQAALQELPLPAEVRRAVDKEVKKLRRLNPSMPDHAVTQTCGAVGHTALATRARTQTQTHTHTPFARARHGTPRRYLEVISELPWRESSVDQTDIDAAKVRRPPHALRRLRMGQ